MSSLFWKIEEKVGCGYYITWEGIFDSKESAEAHIQRYYPGNKTARAVLYTTGGWPSHGQGGPRRAEPLDDPL